MEDTTWGTWSWLIEELCLSLRIPPCPYVGHASGPKSGSECEQVWSSNQECRLRSEVEPGSNPGSSCWLCNFGKGWTSWKLSFLNCEMDWCPSHRVPRVSKRADACSRLQIVLGKGSLIKKKKIFFSLCSSPACSLSFKVNK